MHDLPPALAPARTAPAAFTAPTASHRPGTRPPASPSWKSSRPSCWRAARTSTLPWWPRRTPLSPSFPLYTASIGSADPLAPAVGFFGGIHGLERIGTQLILHYMRALLHRLEWDELLHRQLEKIRLVFMPIVNPGGMWAHKRANPQGVDLMRNAPQRADSRVPWLAGGQTLSALLPWYCGRPGTPMEVESAALLQVVKEPTRQPPLQPGAGLPFGLRLSRQHLVSVCAHAQAAGPPARDVCAADHAGTIAPAPRLQL
jgi:hypothetical protein